jgi:hypothetical protein
MLCALLLLFGVANAQSPGEGMDQPQGEREPRVYQIGMPTMPRSESRVYEIGVPQVKASGVGVGVVAGSQTGLSLAWHPEGWNAFQAGVGWNLMEGRLDTSVDYLRTLTVIRPSTSFHVPVYAGLGGGLTIGMFGERSGLLRAFLGQPRGMEVSARAPLGASVFFDHLPVEIFGQVIPTLRVIPDTGLRIDAGLGARYYF